MRRLALLLAILAVQVPPLSAQDNPLEEFTGVATTRNVIRREGGGFRVETPLPLLALLQGSASRLWSSESAFAVEGDFEFSAKYDVAFIGTKGVPAISEGNAEISTFGWANGAVLGINVGIREKKGDCFNILRVERTAWGTHYNIVTLPRKSGVGRIGMRREGAEIVFLAADGASAEFAELVRYPCGLADAPRLRLSAYQGSATSPVPVNVLFDDMAIKAGRLLRGPDLARQSTPIFQDAGKIAGKLLRGPDLARPTQAPAASPPGAYRYKIDYSANPAGILADFDRTNDKVDAFRVEGNGLRIKPPVAAQHVPDARAYYSHESRYGLAGDFECSYDIDVRKYGPIGSVGYGSVAVGLILETNGPLGSVSIARGFSREQGHRFAINRFTPTPAGGHWDTISFKTKAMAGGMVVRRAGGELTVLAREGAGELRELMRFPFATGPVKHLRLLTDQGGTATHAVDALMSNLVVKAAKINDPGRAMPIVAGPENPTDEPVLLEAAAPPKASRKWLLLGAGLGAAVLLGAAALLFGRRRTES